MFLLGIDLETTGLDTQRDQIIEIGLVLWDVESKAPVCMESYLVGPNNAPDDLPLEIQALTGIKPTAYKNRLLPFILGSLVKNATWSDTEYFVAHNASFEQGFLSAAGIEVDKPWIDTKIHIPYPPFKGEGSLLQIGQMHGVHNPFPHRALFDALAMMQVLAQYDINEVIARAQSPSRTLAITFPFDETKIKNELVKGLGYYWEAGPKQWLRQILECDLNEHYEKAAAKGFSPFLLEVDEF